MDCWSSVRWRTHAATADAPSHVVIGLHEIPGAACARRGTAAQRAAAGACEGGSLTAWGPNGLFQKTYHGTRAISLRTEPENPLGIQYVPRQRTFARTVTDHWSGFKGSNGNDLWGIARLHEH